MTNVVNHWLCIAIALLASSRLTLGLLLRPHQRRHYLTMSTSPTLPVVEQTSFASLVSLYDSYIIDQWGVLHDGKTPYPGVVACLSELKAAGKQLILLSNSSKRRASSFKGLQKVGIDPLPLPLTPLTPLTPLLSLTLLSPSLLPLFQVGIDPTLTLFDDIVTPLTHPSHTPSPHPLTPLSSLILHP
jgi:hypothetical protein